MGITTSHPDLVSTAKAPSVRALAGIAAAGVLSALVARWLSRDLVHPMWAVVGVVLFAASATWWASWRTARRVDPAVALLSLAMCGALAWAAWVPAALVLPQSELLAAVRSEVASAEAVDLWSSVGPGRCVPGDSVDLGVVGDHGNWREVCLAGQTADSAMVTYRPANPHLLTIVYGAGPGIPGACYRRIGGSWWAVADHVPGEARQACEAGFTYGGV